MSSCPGCWYGAPPSGWRPPPEHPSLPVLTRDRSSGPRLIDTELLLLWVGEVAERVCRGTATCSVQMVLGFANRSYLFGTLSSCLSRTTPGVVVRLARRSTSGSAFRSVNCETGSAACHRPWRPKASGEASQPDEWAGQGLITLTEIQERLDLLEHERVALDRSERVPRGPRLRRRSRLGL